MSTSAPASLTGRTVLVANPSADLYGSDRMMLEAVRGLLKQNSRVIATCSRTGPLVDRLQELGVTVHITEVPVIRKSMLSPRGMLNLARIVMSTFPRMRRLIGAARADIVIANTLTLPFWTLAARSCRRPIIVYVHEAESSLSRAARTLLTAPLGLADGVVFNSETSRIACKAQALERRGKVRVVLNGVQGPATSRPPRDHIEGPARLLFVGRLSPRKGPDLIIDAAALLRSMGIAVTVDLVGDVFPGYEWYEDQLRARVRELHLEGVVRFRGFQSPVWEAIDGADMMIVPSRGDESFGNVVIESLLSARPVIVADHTGLREAASGFESAVRVAPDDPKAVADAVRRVLEDWGHFRAVAMVEAVVAQARLGTDRFHEGFGRAVEELDR
ncbi:glycosyltransferase family 4 protein [Brachybacterium paraconglomeratum]|uniref:glycosyltransferase family 4 protein n=1 Tax=Brachybacterium paraconglomeratum TaxID=173362 RepID=UPI0031EACA98